MNVNTQTLQLFKARIIFVVLPLTSFHAHTHMHTYSLNADRQCECLISWKAFCAERRVWHRRSTQKPPTSQLETQANLMARLRFN